jgi:hypothetical protein
MKADKGDIYNDCGYNCLQNAYDCGLAADLFKMRETKFVSDRECDEAESYVADDGEIVNVLHRDKAEAGNTERTENIRANENAGYEICGNCGEVKLLRNTGEKKTDYKRDRER